MTNSSAESPSALSNPQSVMANQLCMKVGLMLGTLVRARGGAVVRSLVLVSRPGWEEAQVSQSPAGKVAG